MKILVIINPASGPDRPILNTLNDVFHPAGVDWDIAITHQAGDARDFAARAAASGVDIVAIYGGDGSVMEATSGLIGSNTPLAIFPGGTANVMSVDLGIPGDLAAAARLAIEGPNKLRPIDIGQVNDDAYFMLRLAAGFEAQMDQYADRQLKDKVGKLAYTVAGIKALTTDLEAHYRFIIDGQAYESTGYTCMVANTGNLGLPGVDLVGNSDVSDGLLDVMVFRKTAANAFWKILTFSVYRSEAEIRQDLQEVRLRDRWKGKSIRVEAEPTQLLVVDGEPVGTTPCEVKVIPAAVKIIVPA